MPGRLAKPIERNMHFAVAIKRFPVPAAPTGSKIETGQLRHQIDFRRKRITHLQRHQFDPIRQYADPLHVEPLRKWVVHGRLQPHEPHVQAFGG